MIRDICTGVLVGSLIFIGNVEAKQKQRPPPIQQEQIREFQTPIEKWCGYFGNLTGGIVVDRDNRVPLSIEVARLRRILHDFFDGAPTPRQQSMIEEMVKMTNTLYLSPEITASEARHIFEVVCLNAALVPQLPSSLSGWR